MCDCGSEPPVFYHDKWVVGRKDYKCCECGASIPNGDRHFMAAGKWGSHFEVYRRCNRCQKLCEAIEATDEAECSVCFCGLFECYGAYRSEWLDDPTDDWLKDLENHYLPMATVNEEEASDG